MDYQEIKRLAKQVKCKTTDLIVLAPQNDPFYVGTKSAIALAEWFTDLWEQFGYTTGVHLRRIHYQIISQEPPILTPNGKPYENTEGCWNSLINASRYARYLGWVDSHCFDDRRNNRPLIYLEQREKPCINIDDNVSIWGDYLELPLFPSLPSYEVENFEAEQRYHLEIWAEKSTQNDTLEPLCRNYHMNLVTGVGELSITQVQWLIDRLEKFQKPCRVFYISDFDPAGRSMPIAVSRKIEKFVQDSMNHFDIRLFPVILTQEQCQKYQLPRTPIKDNEKRKTKFEERYGEGATELDALEALYPGEIRKILKKVVWQYRDEDLNNRIYDAKSRLQKDLEKIEKSIKEEYQDQIDALEKEYEALSEEFSESIEGIRNRFENLSQAIRNELEEKALHIEDYPVPEGQEAEELGEGLYNSDRDYIDQLKAYKQFQGK